MNSISQTILVIMLRSILLGLAILESLSICVYGQSWFPGESQEDCNANIPPTIDGIIIDLPPEQSMCYKDGKKLDNACVCLSDQETFDPRVVAKQLELGIPPAPEEGKEFSIKAVLEFVCRPDEERAEKKNELREFSRPIYEEDPGEYLYTCGKCDLNTWHGFFPPSQPPPSLPFKVTTKVARRVVCLALKQGTIDLFLEYNNK